MVDNLRSLFDVGGKVVVITGAAGGIGQALCKAFRALGANVVGADNRLADAGEGQDAVLLFDLRDRQSILDLAGRVESLWSRVDVLINNAAMGGGGPAESFQDAQWDAVIAANLTGSFACAQAFGRNMIKNGGGKIINLASACGIFGYPFGAAYNASKAGLWSVTQTLAVEWSRFNIQVNAVVPGFVETSMNARSLRDPEEMAIHTGLIPAGRISQPEDLIGPIVFLASAASNYVTGAMLVADGGAVTAGGATLLRDFRLRAKPQ
jgi:NAD(P)-dependent dehydrogenase (short-subunit alcohol dehydrogenase family)